MFMHTKPAPDTDLLAQIDRLQQTVTRLETRVCKLIEHLGATHLINSQPSKAPSKDKK